MERTESGSGQLATEGTNPAAELEHATRSLESMDAVEICRWSIDRFRSDLVVASSFQDCVLIDLVVQADPQAEVIFIDTGFHFPETLEFVDEVTARYGLNLAVLEPAVALDVEPCGSPRCCELRKVEPLNRHLVGKAAWITGLKRIDTPERAEAPIVAWDEAHAMAKINPMAAWTDDDVDRYIDAHHLPRHPLNAKGYISIGCAPTTRPTAPGEDPRSGRWPDSDKTECGLHI